MDFSFDSLDDDDYFVFFKLLGCPHHPSVYVPLALPGAKITSLKALEFAAFGFPSSVKSFIASFNNAASFGVSGVPSVFDSSLSYTSIADTMVPVVSIPGFVPSKSWVPPSPFVVPCSNDSVFVMLLMIIWLICLALTLNVFLMSLKNVLFAATNTDPPATTYLSSSINPDPHAPANPA